MGKKKIATNEEEKDTAVTTEAAAAPAPTGKSSKRRVDSGILCVESTYNNTKLVLTSALRSIVPPLSPQPLTSAPRGQDTDI